MKFECPVTWARVSSVKVVERINGIMRRRLSTIRIISVYHRVVPGNRCRFLGFLFCSCLHCLELLLPFPSPRATADHGESSRGHAGLSPRLVHQEIARGWDVRAFCSIARIRNPRRSLYDAFYELVVMWSLTKNHGIQSVKRPEYSSRKTSVSPSLDQRNSSE